MDSPSGSPLKKAVLEAMSPVIEFLGIEKELKSIAKRGLIKTLYNGVIATVQEAASDYGNRPHTSLLYHSPSLSHPLNVTCTPRGGSLSSPASATPFLSSSYLFSSSFFLLGPPYEYDEYFDGALLFETSQPNCSTASVHSLLNCKVDPNDIDRDDMNFTPMHYCARHCHLAVMRMLIKAKAYVNVMNEFGQTPLSVCVMIKQSLNNHSNQVAMAELLIDKGAYVDVRDKSGCSPLDYAAMNDNPELVRLLLDYGATARRVNDTFAVSRMPPGKTLLDRTKDAECYSLMEERLLEEIAELEYQKEIEAERKRKERLARKLAELKEKHARMKEERILKLQRNKAEKLRAEVRAAKTAQLAKKLALDEALREANKHNLGSWIRDDHHRWHWQGKKVFEPIDHDYVYNQSMKLVAEVRNKRSIAALNKRWKGFTGNAGKIEAKWETLDKFEEIAGKDEEIQKERAASAGGTGKYPPPDPFLKHDDVVHPFDFKDENDHELDGHDLDDMVL